MTSISEVKAVVQVALDAHLSLQEEGEEAGSKKLEQRAAKQIQADLGNKFGGNWNVVLGKNISIAATVGEQEGYAMFNLKDYCVFVFQYNTK